MWRSYFCQAMCICFVRPNFKLFCSRQHQLSFAKSLPDKIHCYSQHNVTKESLKVILSVSLLIIDLSYVQITICIIISYCFNSTSIWQLYDYEVIVTIGYYGINSPSSSTNGIAMSGQAWARTGCVSYTSCIGMNTRQRCCFLKCFGEESVGKIWRCFDIWESSGAIMHGWFLSYLKLPSCFCHTLSFSNFCLSFTLSTSRLSLSCYLSISNSLLFIL